MKQFVLIGLLTAGATALVGCGSDNSIAINTSPPVVADPDPSPDPDPDPGANDQPLAGDQQVLDLIANQTNDMAAPIDINGLGLVFNENPDANVYGNLVPDS
ncbi:hypothetical protein [Abyssibacter profundi]|uniref:Uncharacterized protein n=1 Tax=Abyssibacter profundi TaxID=2182787 RepID=A0A363UPT3_9GAMM|nr:hypothetical protein [Abyssibacter profundi]PWN57491.1 hypothetical protein DEH80_03105 [Abyssibacter profundi]